eukprot:gnl/TRDRNA2_/TRDRNA2_42374_c0_seq1.p1 gnl/TRDRNA2_/TRDRNA2_42374_c0~~gnl/TRDRNA2_/TRDRNA2_42374_c0_seq1.p1  ORF type:complete len:277 (+),score=70.63 gnl/TRDRNA2_/TRDRNA2_42374_c0_seq1:126-833(+)
MKAFKKQGKGVKEWLEKLPEAQLRSLVDEVKKSGSAKRTVPLAEGPFEAEFQPEHVAVEVKKEKQTTTTWMPGVVEPSFGIDRILFSLLEHSYYARAKDANDAEKQIKGVLAFPTSVAPYKLTLLPLDQRIQKDERYNDMASTLRTELGLLGHSYTIDDGGASVGKRYARNDELGIPFAVTVDFTSLEDGTVTLRERDTTKQVRLPCTEVPDVLHDVVWGRRTWQDILGAYPEQQ